MAEAILNHGLCDVVRYPKGVEAVFDEPTDLVVTVCDSVNEACPVFPHPVRRLHLPFRDPHG